MTRDQLLERQRFTRADVAGLTRALLTERTEATPDQAAIQLAQDRLDAAKGRLAAIEAALTQEPA